MLAGFRTRTGKAMNTVTIQDFTRKKRLRLNAVQRRLFEAELARVRKYFPPGKGVPSRMAPDCTITVKRGAKKSYYALFGRAILIEAKSKKQWQFYFGLLLLEWLNT
jgi:hypothetical protein